MRSGRPVLLSAILGGSQVIAQEHTQEHKHEQEQEQKGAAEKKGMPMNGGMKEKMKDMKCCPKEEQKG